MTGFLKKHFDGAVGDWVPGKHHEDQSLDSATHESNPSSLATHHHASASDANTPHDPYTHGQPHSGWKVHTHMTDEAGGHTGTVGSNTMGARPTGTGNNFTKPTMDPLSNTTGTQSSAIGAGNITQSTIDSSPNTVGTQATPMGAGNTTTSNDMQGSGAAENFFGRDRGGPEPGNKGPHGISIANKLDPKVDSDGDGKPNSGPMDREY